MRTASNMLLVALLFTCACSVLGLESPDCPIWHHYNKMLQRCVCIQNNLDGATICEELGDVYLRLDYCMTLDTHNKTTVGVCHRASYNGNQTFRGAFRLLPHDPDLLEETQCKPNNREGLLCATCIPGYGEPVTSLTPKCVKCSSYPTFLAALLYLVIELLPITVFFIIIVFLRISIFSGPLMGYFIFCQTYTVISNHIFELYSFMVDNSSPLVWFVLNGSYILSSIWTLGAFNVLPPLCISPSITSLDAIVLKYVRVLYPLFLVPFTFFLIEMHARNNRPVVWLWRPFGMCIKKMNRNIDTNDSVIHAYATLFFLSFGILNYLSFKVTNLTTLTRGDNGIPLKRRLMSDPTVVGYTAKHAPYLTVAYTMLIFFGAVPSFLVFLYPFRRFRSVLERFLGPRKRIMLVIFLDTLHGNFKNGLNGTRDYRCTMGAIMLVTMAVVIGNAHSTGRYSLLPYLIMGGILIIISLIIAYVKPFKTYLGNLSMSFHTIVSSFMCILLVSWMQTGQVVSNEIERRLFAILAFLPHLMVSLWLLYKLLCLKRLRSLLARIKSFLRTPVQHRLLTHTSCAHS